VLSDVIAGYRDNFYLCDVIAVMKMMFTSVISKQNM
jgi:hypothetical protein